MNRINLDLDDSTTCKVKELLAITDSLTRTEVFRRAVKVYYSLVKTLEEENEEKIVLLLKNGNKRELIF